MSIYNFKNGEESVNYYPVINIELTEISQNQALYGRLLRERAVQSAQNQTLSVEGVKEICSVLKYRISFLGAFSSSSGDPSILFHKPPQMTENGRLALEAMEQMLAKLKESVKHLLPEILND